LQRDVEEVGVRQLAGREVRGALVTILVGLALFELVSPAFAGDRSLTGLTGTRASYSDDYVIPACNDLATSCTNPSYEDVAPRPRLNNSRTEIIKRGDSSQIATSEISHNYYLVDNTQQAKRSEESYSIGDSRVSHMKEQEGDSCNETCYLGNPR
jgi:hypothetical protein